MPYDAIIVGARCAGSPLGLLLARRGYSVLVVDRAKFPSDCLSTHYIHPPGVQRLQAWGLLDRLLATGCPPLHRARMSTPAGLMEQVHADGGFGLCPRRVILDSLLVEAARESGAEVREGFLLQDVLRDGSGAVTGVVGRDADGRERREEARVVVGADGLHSKLASLVAPEEYNRVPTVQCAYYSYYSGIDIGDAIELRGMPGTGMLFFPTHNDQTCVVGIRPLPEFEAFRADIEGTISENASRLGPEVLRLMAGAKREARFYGTADVPHFYRKPYGPGWALVGDSGLHLDPTMGLGISKAFFEVDTLAPHLDNAISGRIAMDEALEAFHRARDEVWLPAGQRNLGLACFVARVPPPVLAPWTFN